MSDAIVLENIENKIYTIRDIQVMIDSDLAQLYQVETKQLNKAVGRNIKRFPDRFRFQLTKEEYDYILRFQNGTSSLEQHGGRRYLPYVFTEQGVSMLSAVLKSDIAIDISIKIIDAFVNMRKFILSNNLMYDRFERIENKLSMHDKKFNQVFKHLKIKIKSQLKACFTMDKYLMLISS